jgi:hypothetical protein
MIALGLSRDEERFDYQAWVGTTDPNGASRLISELNRANDALLHMMRVQVQQDTNRQSAKEYRDSVKEMLPWGAFPIITAVGTGVLPSFVKGLPSSFIDLLPLVSDVVIAMTVVFFGFVGYYGLLLGRTEWRIRRTR